MNQMTLNLYDTEKVKEFLLPVLVENTKLRMENEDLERRISNWIDLYHKQKEQAEASQAKAEELEKVVESLEADLSSAITAGQEGGLYA